MSIKQHNQFDLGIVVPCYNEMNRIQLSEFSQFLSSTDFIFICFVNDGSTDGTQQKLSDFVNRNPERSQLVNLPKIREKQKQLDRESIQCSKLLSISL